MLDVIVGQLTACWADMIASTAVATAQSEIDRRDKLAEYELCRQSEAIEKGNARPDEAGRARLAQIESELGNLYKNLLVGVASPACGR